MTLVNVETISKILANPSWDLIAILFFVAAGFFYGITLGKTKLVAVLLSLYVSALVFENFSYLDQFIKGQSFLNVLLFRILVFAILVVLLAILFNRFLSIDRISGTREWWKIFILSFLGVGLLISFVFRFLPAKEIFNFSPIVKNLFASSRTFFWWLTLPLVALFFVSSKH